LGLIFKILEGIITMAKGQVTKTQTKKPALKTAKEKKQEKQAKKAAKDK
jgi:hypothetical protein